ncbi:hypothetical protein D3C76_1624290 [compost metagenome]
MSQQHHAASTLLFSKSDGCVDAGEDSLGVSLALLVRRFGDGLVRHLGFAARGLFDGRCGGRVFAADVWRFGCWSGLHPARRHGFALQIRQGDTQAAPLGIR